MINAWSLLYDEINGTMDKTYPIKENVMSDKIEIKIEGGDEGVVNVPSDINLDAYKHSDAWYDYTRNDPNRENPFTDPKDRARADRVVGKTDDDVLTITGGDFVNFDVGIGNTSLYSGYSVDTLNLDFSGIEEINLSSAYCDDTISFDAPKLGIETDNPRKYKEDESIKALQDYISTTYGGHYTSDNNNVQTLDLIESVGDAESFCRSNAIKYLSR